ncbi:5-carboxymethyl-2-hydroxymuconate Delta-isomerase [Brevundimonas mediterranea]|uniref:5-carboxymethyl-2-hydroxymuconate isomerase n=1 Tax=Brevundimonas mediterranea TaxID=74329 RepID=A0A7W6A3I0_9CAUL|nr:isomerase [Brevundimonas mediterranea]MBB3870885.1 5-carboxymethyl-2-hydroxymuconate isomerase [Brevundimonas mediterranea]
MPQITLEYTRHLADTDWTPVALEIHQAAVEIAGAALSACKTRLIALDHVVIADDAPETAMLACRIGLMLGRTPEQKSALSERVLEILTAALSSTTGKVEVSAEVFELNETYRKATLG